MFFCFTRAARDTVGCAMCSHVDRLRCNRKIRKYMYDAMQSLLNYSASCRIGAMLNTRNCEIIAKQCARAQWLQLRVRRAAHAHIVIATRSTFFCDRPDDAKSHDYNPTAKASKPQKLNSANSCTDPAGAVPPSSTNVRSHRTSYICASRGALALVKGAIASHSTHVRSHRTSHVCASRDGPALVGWPKMLQALSSLQPTQSPRSLITRVA